MPRRERSRPRTPTATSTRRSSSSTATSRTGRARASCARRAGSSSTCRAASSTSSPRTARSSLARPHQPRGPGRHLRGVQPVGPPALTRPPAPAEAPPGEFIDEMFTRFAAVGVRIGASHGEGTRRTVPAYGPAHPSPSGDVHQGISTVAPVHPPAEAIRGVVSSGGRLSGRETCSSGRSATARWRSRCACCTCSCRVRPRARTRDLCRSA